MLIYFLFILVYAVVNTACQSNSTKNGEILVLSGFNVSKRRTLFSILVFCGLLLLYGLRDSSVGVDISQYKYIYENAGGLLPGFWNFKGDFGYYYFNFFFFSRGVPWQIYLFLVYAIVSLAITLFLHKYSDNVYFSLFLFITIGFFTMSMSGLRQSLGVALCLFSYILADSANKKRKRIYKVFFLFLSLAFWFIAFTMHSSAFVFGVFYIIRYFKIKRTWVLAGIIIVLLSFLYGGYLLNAFQWVFPERYKDYSITDAYNVHPLLIAVYVVFILFTCFAIPPTEAKKYYSKTDSLMFVFALLNLLFLCLSIHNNQIGRLRFYFLMPATTMISNALCKLKVKERQLFYFVITVSSLVFFWIVSTGGTLQIDHYKFFFS